MKAEIKGFDGEITVSAIADYTGATVGGVAEVTPITCVADVASNLEGKFFSFYAGPTSALKPVRHFAWYDLGTRQVSTIINAGISPDDANLIDGQYFLVSKSDVDYYAWFNLDSLGGDPGVAAAETTTVDMTGLADTDFAGGEYFTISSPTTDYYVWFQDDAVGADPAPAGLTGILVDIVGVSDDQAIADFMVTAIDAMDDFGATDASGTSPIVTVVNAANGAVVNAVDVDSGATILTTVSGVTIAADTVDRTGIEIAISTADDAAAVSDLMETALDAISGFGCTNGASTTTNTLTLDASGAVTYPHAGTSGFTVATPTPGVDTDGVGFTVPDGGVGVKITISEGATENEVALATKNAIDALDAFGAGVSSALVTITNADTGVVNNASVGDSGFTLGSITQGVDASDVTLTAGQFVSVTGVIDIDETTNEAFSQIVPVDSVTYITA